VYPEVAASAAFFLNEVDPVDTESIGQSGNVVDHAISDTRRLRVESVFRYYF
jgi:hypothetical protein